MPKKDRQNCKMSITRRREDWYNANPACPGKRKNPSIWRSPADLTKKSTEFSQGSTALALFKLIKTASLLFRGIVRDLGATVLDQFEKTTHCASTQVGAVSSTTHLAYQQFVYTNSKVAAELSGLQYCSKNFPLFSCPSSVHVAENAWPCQTSQTEGSSGLKRTHDLGRMSRQRL